MMESMLQQVQASANFTSLMLGAFLNTEDSTTEDPPIMDMINPMNSGIENTVPDMMELLKPDLHPSDCPQGDTVNHDGTVRVEGSTSSVGTTHCSDDPLLGQTESFIGVLKTSFYCIEKDGKVIEQGGTLLLLVISPMPMEQRLLAYLQLANQRRLIMKLELLLLKVKLVLLAR